MLREHYPLDKLFEEILGYVPNLSPELEKIDGYLEDEKLYRLIKKDLSQRQAEDNSNGKELNTRGCDLADAGGETIVWQPAMKRRNGK